MPPRLFFSSWDGAFAVGSLEFEKVKGETKKGAPPRFFPSLSISAARHCIFISFSPLRKKNESALPIKKTVPLDAARRLLWAVTTAAAAGSLAAAAWDFDPSGLPPPPPPLFGALFAAAASPPPSLPPQSSPSSSLPPPLSSRSLLVALTSLVALFLASWRLGLLEREQRVYMRDLAVWKPLER